MSRKEKSTIQIDTFMLQLASYNLLNKHVLKHNSSNSEKQFLRENSDKNENKFTEFKRNRVEQQIRIFSQVIYYKFMIDDQTESVNLACDNIRDHNLMMIK